MNDKCDIYMQCAGICIIKMNQPLHVAGPILGPAGCSNNPALASPDSDGLYVLAGSLAMHVEREDTGKFMHDTHCNRHCVHIEIT
jgi:hypothetical protein